MRTSKHWLKATAFSILASLGLIAFTAAAAQAQNPNPLTDPVITNTPGFFTINSADALLATFTGASEAPAIILVPGRNLEIECDAVDVQEGHIQSKTQALAKFLFLKCIPYNLGGEVPIAGCHIIPDLTITMLATILPILHGTKDAKGEYTELKNYLLLEPDNALQFGSVLFKSGLGCGLTLHNPLKGSVVAEVKELEAVQHLIKFNSEIQLLVGDKLQFGTFTAYIDLNAKLELTNTHFGKTLGIH